MKSSRPSPFSLIPGALAVMFSLCSCRDKAPGSPVAVPRRPQLTPDYVDVVIPPNIAPLNFVIEEPGAEYVARIHAESGTPVEVASRTGRIIIPPRRWRALLRDNAGSDLKIDIRIKNEAGTWNRYQTITNRVAAEQIDPYLVYRYMMPSSYFPKRMRIRQRHLESFREETVLDTESFDNGCANCHSFIQSEPDRILIGTRSTRYPSATLYVHDGKVERIGAKFGYTAWHPSGRIVTYSVNQVKQFFHTVRTEIHDVIDLDSAIFYYDVEEARIKTSPAIADKTRLETYPAWTPDGTYLYFCSAPLEWADTDSELPRQYREIKYDLMRVGYDVDTDTWAAPETVLSAADTGLSILLPRVSPDGRFLLFCMTQYGCFPIYQPSSDLYLMDLSTGTYHQAPINSAYAEAWHSFSSNSRWIVFSSKRQGGLFTRPYLSYVDSEGQTHKPFVLPQQDPSFYESCCYVYSVPELLSEPVTIAADALLEAIRSPTQIAVDAVTGATAEAPSTEAYKTGQPGVQ